MKIRPLLCTVLFIGFSLPLMALEEIQKSPSQEPSEVIVVQPAGNRGKGSESVVLKMLPEAEVMTMRTVMEEVVLPSGEKAIVTKHIPTPPPAPLPVATPFDAEKEKVYVSLAMQYFHALPSPKPPKSVITDEEKAEWQEEKTQALSNFVQCAGKISPQARIELINQLTKMSRYPEYLKVLEVLLDNVGDLGPPIIFTESDRYSVVQEEPIHVVRHVLDYPLATPDEMAMLGRVVRDDEVVSIPEFIVNSSVDDLAKKLAQSIAGDGEDFLAVCKSILALTNKPMSSPWFELGEGRMQRVKYSLSARGQMFVHVLRVVKNSGGYSEKAQALRRVAEKTLEKIELILE